MSYGFENPPARAPVQVVLALKANHWHKEIGREQQKSSAKLRRSHADNRIRPLVHFRRAAHNASVVLKMTVPIRIAEHDVRSAAHPMLIGRVEEASEIRLKLQYVEVIPAHFIKPRTRRILACVQPHPGHLIHGQAVEAAVAIPEIHIVRIRQRTPVPSAKLQSVEALRLRHIEWAEQKGI